mgnify:CR=1 FL=1
MWAATGRRWESKTSERKERGHEFTREESGSCFRRWGWSGMLPWLMLVCLRVRFLADGAQVRNQLCDPVPDLPLDEGVHPVAKDDGEWRGAGVFVLGGTLCRGLGRHVQRLFFGGGDHK